MFFKFAFASLTLCILATLGFVLNMPTPTPGEPIASHVSTTSRNLALPRNPTTTKTVVAKLLEQAHPSSSAPRAQSSTSTPAPASGAASITSTSSPASSTAAVQLLASTTAEAASSTDFVTKVESNIHLLVNSERVKAGLASLTYSTEVATLADAHSADMLAQNYFAHEDPAGCGMECRFKKINYLYLAIGENIYQMSGYSLSAEDTAKKIVEGWMNSPGHRANILNTDFTTEGIGVAMKDKEIYATQDMAKPL